MDGPIAGTPAAHLAVAQLPVAHLRVLASGSSGNCSILVVHSAAGRRVCLLDAGLSPRRTMLLLERSRLDPDEVTGILLTHLDHDHLHAGWRKRLPSRWQVWLSRTHASMARRREMLPDEPMRIFDDRPFEPAPGVSATPIEASHDDLGVASFRFDIRRNGDAGSLGFATDLGRVPERMVVCMRGVGVLAIESNYCPDLQQASSRPWYLKKRIMGGSGHLSNDEALRAVTAIEPLDHVVLLHLSRECNDPSLAASLHAGSDYALTVTSQDEPSRWIEVRARPAPEPRRPALGEQLDMFPVGAAPYAD